MEFKRGETHINFYNLHRLPSTLAELVGFIIPLNPIRIIMINPTGSLHFVLDRCTITGTLRFDLKLIFIDFGAIFEQFR